MPNPPPLHLRPGICYGKPEAFALALLTPALLLTHLADGGGSSGGAVRLLAAATAAAALLFAARKWSQPVREDIGDGSVFEFRRLGEAEQAERLAELDAARAAGGGWRRG